MRYLFTIVIFIYSLPLKSQSDWAACCRGYDEGYKKGYSYPNLDMSNTVSVPYCNCTGIVGSLTYETGYIKGYEDGKSAKALLIQQTQPSQAPQQTPKKTKFQTHDYIDPYPYGYNGNNESDASGLLYFLLVGWHKIFPEFGLGLSKQYGSNQLLNTGGQIFWHHDFGRRFRGNIDFPGRGFFCLGMDYNFNSMRPILNYYNDENSIINPYMGFSTYFLSEKYKTPYAYCGTIGVEYWIKEKNPTWRAGFGFKYILGTNNINMIQLSMIAKILKF